MSEGDMQKAVDLYLDMGGGAGSTGQETASSSNYRDQLFADEGVREAIPARYDQLLGDPMGVHPSIQEWISGSPIFQEAEEEPSEITHQVTEGGIGELYRAPIELNTPGTLQDAMVTAKASSKWLLVNIQSEEEFASFVLNRDVWSHGTVREVLKSFYVFFQRDKSTPQGSQFLANYGISDLPSVCIIDPRTGRKIKQWPVDKLKGPLAAADLLSDFIGEYPYGSAVAPPVKLSSSPPPKSPTVAASTSVIDIPPSPAPASVFAALPADMPGSDEPSLVKVAIRLPDGKKKQVSFRPSQPITALRDWISATEQLPVCDFEVRISHPPTVIEFGDGSIETAGIAGNVLVVVPKQ
jgi:hypothetical protein